MQSSEGTSSSQPPKQDPHQAAMEALGVLADRLLNFFAANLGLVVQNGPFAGMQYVERSIGSSLMPKLLGSYEANLQPVIEDIILRAPATIVNIGCGEGYYAVGLARRLPRVQVHAFEADATGQALCQKMAERNQVGGRVTVGGVCTIEHLRQLCPSRPLILCDCEGCERELLDPAKVPELARCEILVELHDFVDRTITPTIVQRFSPSHHVNVMPDTGRNPHAYPTLRKLPEIYQYLAVMEGRPESMSWARLMPRENVSA